MFLYISFIKKEYVIKTSEVSISLFNSYAPTYKTRVIMCYKKISNGKKRCGKKLLKINLNESGYPNWWKKKTFAL